MDENLNQNKRHFLVVAAASRGARFFIKKALRQGHNVTGLCRAESDKAALERITKLLQETELTSGGVPAANKAGKLLAKNSNILDAISYKELLEKDASIDAIVCYVGVAEKIKDLYSKKLQLYTKTYGAIVEGMRKSRWVETFIHGSSGSEGIPGQHKFQLPANFKLKWFLKLLGNTPATQNYFKSEHILADAKKEGLKFILFRPAFLVSSRAKRNYGYCFDTTGFNNIELPLKKAKMSISREDVAEEILRVATLSEINRKKYYGHGVYLVDLKKTHRH
ncbi:MAG: hypothetical protein ACPG5B_09050 [Chitinophagales bacterium]